MTDGDVPNPVPVIVTTFPPAVLPLVTSREVITGAADAVGVPITTNKEVKSAPIRMLEIRDKAR